jgi:hypothetical protein
MQPCWGSSQEHPSNAFPSPQARDLDLLVLALSLPHPWMIATLVSLASIPSVLPEQQVWGLP